MAEVKKCLDIGIDPNHIFDVDYPITAIHIAAEKGNPALAYRLSLCPGINLNMKTEHGNTALHIACILRKKKFVNMLLQQGADPNATCRMKKTPLHICALNGNYGIILHLIRYKAKVNVLDCFENTPLSLSLLAYPNILIAKYLLNNGVDFQLEEKRQLHIFFEVVLQCHDICQIDYVNLLLDYGVDIKIIDKNTGRNCLHFVAISGFVNLAVTLVEQGADLTVMDYSSRTPLMVARDHGNLFVFEYFQKGYRPPNMFRALPAVLKWKKKIQENRQNRVEEAMKSGKTS